MKYASNNQIVPVEQIPSSVQDCPTDNLVELYNICMTMQKVCDENNGIGLSAVQLGIPYKLFVIKKKDATFFEGAYGWFVNCEYAPTKKAKRIDSIEGCLSIKDSSGELRFFELKRYDEVRLTGKLLQVKEPANLALVDIDCVLDGQQQSVAFQHEIDHHHMILISQLGNEVILW